MVERENLEAIADAEEKEIPFDELAPMAEKYVHDFHHALRKNATYNRVLQNIFLAPEKYVGGNYSLEEGKRGNSVVFHRNGFVFRVASEGGYDVSEKISVDRFFKKNGKPDWETEESIKINFEKQSFNQDNGSVTSGELIKANIIHEYHDVGYSESNVNNQKAIKGVQKILNSLVVDFED